MQSSFVSDSSTTISYDDYLRTIRQLLSWKCKDVIEHWGVIWAALRSLVNISPGTLATKTLNIQSNQDDTLKSEFMKQFYLMDLSEGNSQLKFSFELSSEMILSKQFFLQISQNQCFTIHRFNIFSKANKSDVAQLIHTHSPITYTYIINVSNNIATVLHIIYIPIVLTSKQLVSPYFLVCLTLRLPLPKGSHVDINERMKDMDITPTEEINDSNVKEQSTEEFKQMELSEQNKRNVYQKQHDALHNTISFEKVKELSIYKDVLLTLTDSINLMVYNATLIIFQNINVQTYRYDTAKTQSVLYINNTLRDISESFDIAVDCISKPIQPIYEPITVINDQVSFKRSPFKKSLFSKDKTISYPFSPQFVSMAITAHMETCFTLILAQSDTTKSFFHSLFNCFNPPGFATTSNAPHTCFPYFIPRRNWFIRTSFLTELEHRNLYEIPYPFCIINCQTMQVAVSKSSSLFEHFSYRASAHISLAAKTLNCPISIAVVPPNRSVRMLQRCPTTENIANYSLAQYFSNHWKRGCLEIIKFLEYYQQKARIAQSVIQTQGITIDVLNQLEELFNCREQDEMMLIISLLKSDSLAVSSFYSLIEKRLRIDN